MGYNEAGKLCFAQTYKHWIEYHSTEIERYLFECVEEYSRPSTKTLFEDFPLLGKTVVEDFLINSDDLTHNPARTIKHMSSEGNEISLLSGSRGSGKTSTATRVIEDIHKENGAQQAFIGPPNTELEKHGWKWCVNMGELEKDDYALYDESALFLNARRSSSKTNMDVLIYIPTLRHAEVDGIIFLTQSTKKSDVALTDWANAHIIKDYSDAYGMDVERGKINDDLILDYMSPRPNYITPSSIKAWSFVRTSKFKHLVMFSEVPWYSDKVGKAYGHLNEDEAVRFATEMVEHDFPLTQVRDTMKLRGFDKDLLWWKAFSKVLLAGEAPPRPEGVPEELDSTTRAILDNDEGIKYTEEICKGKHKEVSI